MQELEKTIDRVLAEFDIPSAREAIEAWLAEPRDLLNKPQELDNDAYLKSLFKISILHFGFGDKKQAIEGWQQYLIVAQENNLPDDQSYAQVLLFIGSALESDGAFSKSLEYYKNYQIFAKVHLGASEQSLGHYRQGKIFMIQGLYREALDEFLKIRPHKPKLDVESIIDAESALAAAYIRLGDFVSGERVFDQLDELLVSNEIEVKQLIAITNNRAILYQELYQYERAIGYFKKLILWEKDRNPKSESLIRYFNNAALAYHENGESEKGQELLEEALLLSEETLPPVHLRRADLYNNYGINLLGQGRAKEALSNFEYCEQILDELENNNHLRSSLSTNLGACHAHLADAKKALSYFQRAQTLLKETLPSYHHEHTDLLLHKTIVYEELGLLKDTQSCFEQARLLYQKQISLYFFNLSQAEKEIFFFTVFHFYEMYISFLLRMMGKDPEAMKLCYELVVESKNFLMEETVAFQRILRGGTDEETKLKAKRLSDLRKALSVEGRGAKQRYDSSIREINKLEKELSQKVNVADIIDYEKVASVLEEEEALIEIFRINYYQEGVTEIVKYLFFIIDSRGISMISSDDHVTLENEAIERYYENLGQAKLSEEYAWKALWEPVWREVDKTTTSLWVVPDGVYHRLNLETLFDPKEGRFLGDIMTLRHLSSTKSLIQSISSSSEEFPPLENVAVYYPVNDQSKKGYLPAGKTEIESLRNTFADLRFDCFEGSNATGKALLEAEPPGILHVITHGYFHSHQKVKGKLTINKLRNIDLPSPKVDQAMFNSGLMMYGEGSLKELTAYEVSTMKLDGTQLVTLSACESALGSLIHGGGAYGLIRAFRIAGAKSIMASLWKVSDEVTALFMSKFYKAFSKNWDSAKAFKWAQEQTREQYLEPYYWGAFVIYH